MGIRTSIFIFISAIIITLLFSCQSKKISYASPGEMIAKNHVKKKLVYEYNEDVSDTIPEHLYSITEYNEAGLETKYMVINSYQGDTSVWEYIYEEGRLVKEIGYFDLYPTEMTNEYDATGLLVRSKLGGAEPRDIQYYYDNDHNLIMELGMTAYPGEDGDSLIWSVVDSTEYHYEDGLLKSQQFYYNGNMFSDVHYEIYNEQGQCTKEVDYRGEEKPLYSVEKIYGENGLLNKTISHDLYDDRKTYHIMVYEFYD